MRITVDGDAGRKVLVSLSWRELKSEPRQRTSPFSCCQCFPLLAFQFDSSREKNVVLEMDVLVQISLKIFQG